MRYAPFARTRILLFALTLILCAFGLRATEPWGPQVSLEEHWRWTELEGLKEYDIISGVNGREGEVWFVHTNGLLSFDGYGVKNHPIPGLKSERILKFNSFGDGRLFITSEAHIIIWENGHSRKIPCPAGTSFIRCKVVQNSAGLLFVATQKGIYEMRDDRLIEVKIEQGKFNSILIDAKDHLWVSGKNGFPISVYQLTILAGAPVAVLLHQFESNNENPYGPRLFMDSRDRVWVIDPDENDQSYLYEDFVRKPSISGLREHSFLSDSLNIIETSNRDIWLSVSRKLAHWNGRELKVYSIEDYPIPSSYPYLIDLPGDRLLIGGQKLVPLVINLSAEKWATYAGLNFQCEDREGGLWFIAKDREVVRQHGGSWRVFAAEEEVISRPNRIIAAADGSIWASGAHCQEAAVAWYVNGQWHSRTFPEVGTTFSHLAAIQTSEGDLVFGGGTVESQLEEASGGAVVFTKQGEHYEAMHYPPPTFPARIANIVAKDGEGLFCSTLAVFKVSPDIGFVNQTEGLLSNQWIDHMIVDHNNDLWIAGVGAGVMEYRGGDWQVHGYAMGLNTKNVVYLLDYKEKDQLLALTDEGFYAFDGMTWGKWGFPLEFPFRRENHTLFQSSDGAIWINFTSRRWLLEGKSFGRHNYEFQTIRYVPDATPPQTHARIPHTRYPEGSLIQVQLEGSDFWDETVAGDLVYAWSLDGKKWSAYIEDAGVTLSDVVAGDYNLYIRARDRDGNVDPSPAVASFQIVPPLWRQAWFIMVVIAVAGLILFLLYTLYRIRLKAALALDEFKLDFFTNLSHELRNPLAVIISPIEILLESDFDTGTRQKLQIVLRNARKMQSMVDQLLQFRKIEKRRWNVNHEGGEIISFAREAVMNHELIWRGKNQELVFSASQESFLCSFDSSILQKVIDNLVSNAIKYSEESTTLRVKVGIETIDDHDHIQLVVEDEGTGIPLHEQKHVLQPFYRVQRNTHQEGSGVGLAMVSQLVNLWGGTIEIKSPLAKDGRGTRFTVMLPLEAFAENKEREATDPEKGHDRNGRPALLFVEDNDDMRHILCDAFSRQYHVIEAGDGTNGYKLAQKLNPDLVVSDVMMPGMNGFELCHQLKNNPETSHIPIVLLTAKSSVEHRIEGIQSGADAYISKPLDVNHLRARVENLLESRRELKSKFARQLVIEATEITVTPMDEKILSKAIKVAEDHMEDEDFNIDRFAEEMGMSRSSLKRKLKAITGQTPQPFVQQLRLKRAAQLLSSGGMSVSEVAAKVGFYDVSYFGKIFKKEFGMSPSHYREEGTRPVQARP